MDQKNVGHCSWLIKVVEIIVKSYVKLQES